MKIEDMLHELNSAQEFFHRSARCLAEEHGDFRPTPGQMTVTQQIAHTAQTIDWFAEGAFAPSGFDMNFASHFELVMQTPSVTEARAWLDRAFADARTRIEQVGQAGMDELIAANPIMGDVSRWHIVTAIVDHTAHHRGALTVYSRLLGLSPAMPYAD